MMILRTDENRFQNLPDYPYSPNYLQFGEARMHYVDENRGSGDTVLMLHGEPSWSFLYRKMIPIVNDEGHRVVAPDLIGFGKSDKFADRDDYTYQMHVDSIVSLIENLDLNNITLMCQDWGGLIGLRVAAEYPDRFSRIVAANTFLPTGDEKVPAAFKAWLKFSQVTPFFPVGKLVSKGCATKLSKEVIKAYDAPFPDKSYKAGARHFPALVPITPDNPASEANREAWKVLHEWKKPFLTAFSDKDPITRGGDKILRRRIPGAKGQAHFTIEGGGHFLQEDKGEELAEVIVNFIRSS
ncbi:MAG: haloalkane dehalogenase [Pyrinomonadaceae bacterium]|nr:haloalkane dehalogenase [Pyrinomonadaceae bacterium]